MRGVDATLEVLKRGGVDAIFGIPGGGPTADLVSSAGALGVEFVSPSVTSSGLPEAATPLLRTLFGVLDPHIKYFDGAQHGYVLLDITRERIQGEWWYVDSILDPAAGETFAYGLYSRSGENRLRVASGPSEPKPA